MTGFSTHNGDVVVGKDIELVSDAELLRQKVQRVIGTNQGEWRYDPEEGIDFSVILRKSPDADEIRSEIEQALWRLDDTFAITEFGLEKKGGRHAVITFRAVNKDGIEVGGSYDAS